MTTKKSLNEAEICDQYITTAVIGAGWDRATQIRREYAFTAGRVIVRGKLTSRGKQRRADYLLFYAPHLPLAVIEAKDNNHAVGAGIQQSLDYALALDVPFVFSSNGDGFLFHDRTGQSEPVEREIGLDEFPSPDELWARYARWKKLDPPGERMVRYPYHQAPEGKEPRYYQRVAVQRVVEAVAGGKDRVLLVMATGTGKTLVAFQIIWRLWKAGTVKRVLFLADRNILIDQTMTNDFKPFGQVMTKVQHRQVDKSYEVYLALYQAVTGSEEEKQIYRQFSRDFFDLVVIDECHRGSAREQSAWREILDWFSPATQLGMTATPKESGKESTPAYVSTVNYFGGAIYTYSLRQGIEDGFLAPYKVVRIDLDKDLQGWRPSKGKRDDTGKLIQDRTYNQRDMDRILVLQQRTKLVAEKVVQYMMATDPYGKAIVFCEDIEHASRMRTALLNEVGKRYPEEKAAGNLSRMVVQITGDNEEGIRALDDFIHPERRYPVIATTSKLLGTGVDARTCKLIVLDQRIESMVEFKQIIGRGTRIHEEAGKLWFTIIDFKKATELFADPTFDGEPISLKVKTRYPHKGGEGGDSVDKYMVSDVAVKVLDQRVQYLDVNGRLITESLTDYTRSSITRSYQTLGDFLRRWTSADRKQAVVDELREQGVMFEELRSLVGRDLDPFDLVCHVAYDRPPLTRRERAENVKKRDVFTRHGEQARIVLAALLEKYADQGVLPEETAVLRVAPLSGLGTPVELVSRFGGKEKFLAAILDLEAELYRATG